MTVHYLIFSVQYMFLWSYLQCGGVRGRLISDCSVFMLVRGWGGGDIWGQLSGQHAAADNTRLQTLLLKFIATGSVGGGGRRRGTENRGWSIKDDKEYWVTEY